MRKSTFLQQVRDGQKRSAINLDLHPVTGEDGGSQAGKREAISKSHSQQTLIQLGSINQEKGGKQRIPYGFITKLRPLQQQQMKTDRKGGQQASDKNGNLMQALVKSLSKQTKDQVMGQASVFEPSSKSGLLSRVTLSPKYPQEKKLKPAASEAHILKPIEPTIDQHRTYIDQVLQVGKDAHKAS